MSNVLRSIKSRQLFSLLFIFFLAKNSLSQEQTEASLSLKMKGDYADQPAYVHKGKLGFIEPKGSTWTIEEQDPKTGKRERYTYTTDGKNRRCYLHFVKESSIVFISSYQDKNSFDLQLIEVDLSTKKEKQRKHLYTYQKKVPRKLSVEVYGSMSKNEEFISIQFFEISKRKEQFVEHFEILVLDSDLEKRSHGKADCEIPLGKRHYYMWGIDPFSYTLSNKGEFVLMMNICGAVKAYMLNKKGDLEKFNLENFCADGLMSVADEEGQFYVVSRNSKKISWFLLGDDNSERFSTIVNSNLSELKLRKVDIVDKDIIVILDEYEITETYEGDNNRPTKRYRYENIFVLKLGTNGEHFWTHEKIRHLDTSVSGERSKAVGIGAMMVNGQLLLVWNENVKKHGSITSNFEFLDMKTGSIKMQRELVKGVGVHFRHVGLLSVSNKLPSATFYIPNNDISWSIIGEDLKHSYGDACFRYIINLKF